MVGRRTRPLTRQKRDLDPRPHRQQTSGMTSVRLFISLSCFQEGNKMRLLLGLRGYGSLLCFAQIWVKEKNYVILFYNLKANHCQLSMSKYKGSFLRKYPGVIIQRNVRVTRRSLGETVPRVQSIAHPSKAGRSGRRRPGVAKTPQLALPCARDTHWRPQTLPVPSRMCCPHHLAVLPISLKRPHLPAAQERLPGGMSVRVSLCAVLPVCGPGWRLAGQFQVKFTPPITSLRGACASGHSTTTLSAPGPSTRQSGQPLRHQSSRKFFKLACLSCLTHASLQKPQ